jgi:hypothetical protein
MKKLLIIVVLVLCALSCSDNANLQGQLSPATSSAEKTKGEILYAGYYETITRIWIDGLPYLVNSKGGIILEASEAEYAALVDRSAR